MRLNVGEMNFIYMILETVNRDTEIFNESTHPHTHTRSIPIRNFDIHLFNYSIAFYQLRLHWMHSSGGACSIYVLYCIEHTWYGLTIEIHHIHTKKRVARVFHNFDRIGGFQVFSLLGINYIRGEWRCNSIALTTHNQCCIVAFAQNIAIYSLYLSLSLTLNVREITFRELWKMMRSQWWRWAIMDKLWS